MRKNKKELAWIAAAFLLLCAVSAYRQISLRFFTNDPFRPAVVFFVYLILLAGWWVALRRRIVQGNMRVFLLAEHAVMLFGATVRFLQDAYLSYSEYINISFMRISGYASVVPLLLLPLLGLYSSFGLGKPEEYRIDRKWHYLSVPAGILILLMLTNESHNLIFHALEDEALFLYFQPNWGIFIVFAWAFILLISRILLIFLRSREMKAHTRFWIAPFIIAVSMMVYIIPYLTGSFVTDFELVEFIISLFFMEVLVWESCILVGMVPVNTRYEEVFDLSTVAMQIMDREGRSLLRSACAPELSAEMFSALTREPNLRAPEGKELHIHPVKGGYAVWQSDISQIIEVMDEMQQSVERLENESDILRQEIKVQSENAAIKEQNRIYDRLTDEVGDQLLLLHDLLKNQEQAVDKGVLFRKICLIGTYVKRRCNLRLIEQSDGRITDNDLALCFNELTACLRQMGVEADVLWNTTSALSSEFAIFTLDFFEFLLENEHFDLHSIKAAFEPDNSFLVSVCSNSDPAEKIPFSDLQRINRESYDIEWQTSGTGYQVSVRSHAARRDAAENDASGSDETLAKEVDG